MEDQNIEIKFIFKNNKIHIDIKVSKNETQIANELLLGIKIFLVLSQI